MSPRNVLILMSDEHLRDAAGCYGSPIVQTPNLDHLAAGGTLFSTAYTPCPVCVPARASLATGRYIHQIRRWGNAMPYDGTPPGWGHRLMAAGHQVVSAGKLHHRSIDDPNGYSRELEPMHVRNGTGWVRGLLRDNAEVFDARDFAAQIGPGECSYDTYDRRVCAAACDWLRGEVAGGHDRPWTLLVSFARPHYPLTCPQEFYDRYPLDAIDPPRLNRPGELPEHPVVEFLRNYMDYDDHFNDHTRLVALASYYGLCSFLDHNIGRVLQALRDSDQYDNTLIVYTSDHGDCLGNHGIWTKCVMYEESAAIPMMISGPGIPAGKVVDTPASLIDIHQTVLEGTGLGLTPEDAELPGCSLIQMANGYEPDRHILSEYHDGGALTGMFMIRHDRWKYICYPGYEPQLFDMHADPTEADDLGQNPDYAGVRECCHRALMEILDPDEINALAFADQAARIEELGGPGAIMASEDYDFTPVEGPPDAARNRS